MEGSGKHTTDNEIVALREGIKSRYQTYHLHNRVKYPLFEYNTNRANYEPLRESFEEEFFIRRGINRVQNHLHIPSTNTLALLFTDDSYRPGKKILNTCYLYAEGSSTFFAETSSSVPTATNKKLHKRSFFALLTGTIVLISLGSYFFTQELPKPQRASGLSISVPIFNLRVPRLIPVEGKVTNADTVWVVVKPPSHPGYFVQWPIKVDPRGHWRGSIVIGDTSMYNNGQKFQVRAFVSPKPPTFLGDVLQEWPNAELASNIIEVVRQDERYVLPTGDLTIYSPHEMHTVPRQVIIEGKAMNADTVWVVIHPVGSSGHWVQPPIKVAKNGRWKGIVYVGDPGDADVGWPNQIRAFVRPVDPIKFDDVLYEWPKAERSSNMVHVIRGPKDK